MENASKALIIAGAILISIMIVSLGVLIFNKMGNSAKEAANMDEQEIANFNSKLTPYIGQNVNGSQVNALIQLVISIDKSAESAKDTTKVVSIKYPIDDAESNTNTIYVDESGAVKESHEDYPKRVITGAGKFYKVEAKYKDGLISEITVRKQ